MPITWIHWPASRLPGSNCEFLLLLRVKQIKADASRPRRGTDSVLTVHTKHLFLLKLTFVNLVCFSMEDQLIGHCWIPSSLLGKHVTDLFSGSIIICLVITCLHDSSARSSRLRSFRCMAQRPQRLQLSGHRMKCLFVSVKLQYEDGKRINLAASTLRWSIQRANS